MSVSRNRVRDSTDTTDEGKRKARVQKESEGRESSPLANSLVVDA